LPMRTRTVPDFRTQTINGIHASQNGEYGAAASVEQHRKQDGRADRKSGRVAR
jgi:hypothetical protein